MSMRVRLPAAKLRLKLCLDLFVLFSPINLSLRQTVYENHTHREHINTQVINVVNQKPFAGRDGRTTTQAWSFTVVLDFCYAHLFGAA